MADTTLKAPATQIDVVPVALTILIAGAFSTIAFDFFGKALSPALGYATLAPVGLANGLISTLFGSGWRPGAEMLHYFAGLVAYPAGWVLIVEPLRRNFAPQLPWWSAAFVYGMVLWVFALYFVAHLIVGNRPFLGFTGITYVAFWGHVLFAMVTATVTRLRQQ
ncbi:MAG: hypothetical protein AAGF74_16425 [Pseudomonadota bacterium]